MNILREKFFARKTRADYFIIKSLPTIIEKNEIKKLMDNDK
jgi:hypothetical protein